MASTVDFSKAFNRLNHNLLIEKLADMGVPGWLLKIVIGFLTNRHLRVKYKGTQSDLKPMPGGGPAGTVLGMFLFIIMINPIGTNETSVNIGKEITNSLKGELKQLN